MRTTAWLCASVMALGLAAMQAAPTQGGGAQNAAGTVAVDADDIGGVVTGPKGPEAGVWVIAETTGPADEVRAGSSSPMIADGICSRSAEGELQRVGARLRAGRLAEGAGDAGHVAESDGGGCAESARRRRSTTRPATGSR